MARDLLSNERASGNPYAGGLEEYTLEDALELLLKRIGDRGFMVYGDGSGYLTAKWFHDDPIVEFGGGAAALAAPVRGERHEEIYDRTG